MRAGPLSAVALAGAVLVLSLAVALPSMAGASGADVAQLYLGDPAAAGEPPRQLVGFRRVNLSSGQSARVQFTITPRDTWWWDQTANGWSQSEGRYQVYVGDSSALEDLPLHGPAHGKRDAAPAAQSDLRTVSSDR